MHTGTKQAVLNLINVMNGSKEVGFNMGDWVNNDPKSDKFEDKSGHECKTTCCFAGFTVYGLNEDGTIKDRLVKRKAFMERLRHSFTRYFHYGGPGLDADALMRHAKTALALTETEADHLFDPDNVDLRSVSFSQGLRVLKHFAKTGEIDWKRVLRSDQYYAN
jgi:hypothetical protein